MKQLGKIKVLLGIVEKNTSVRNEGEATRFQKCEEQNSYASFLLVLKSLTYLSENIFKSTIPNRDVAATSVTPLDLPLVIKTNSEMVTSSTNVF